MQSSNILDDLRWRGLLFQCTDEAALSERLDKGPLTLYAGFDPTATSLHVGNLVPLLTLARFQNAGHRSLALVGGSTGLIGDPSGKSAERDFQDADAVKARTAQIAAQLGLFLRFDDQSEAKLVNNLDWTSGVGILDFLRDVGKYFSVNAMLTRDSVKSRLDRAGDGISFTEFSYMLLQAFDFLKLSQNEDCCLQIGGSDQWGNMCSGVDLIHRKLDKPSFALTLPLLTTHDGKKFGKSEKGAIWLDPALTTPWDFMQFWKNTDDKDVIRFIKLFTFLSRDSVEWIEESLLKEPHLRAAQDALATAMTDMVHGKKIRMDLQGAADVLFGRGDVHSLSSELLESIAPSVNHFICSRSDLPSFSQLLVSTSLETSITRANRVIEQGGVSVNQVKLNPNVKVIRVEDFLHGRFAVLKKGKRDFAIIELA